MVVRDYFAKTFDLCDVLLPIEELPMEEDDYVTCLLSCFEEFS
jgi:hypothetical protein